MKNEHNNHGRHPGKFHRQPITTEDKLIRQIRFCGRFLRHNTEHRGSQRHVLARLQEHGKLTQKELMESMRIKSGSVSELLGKIEQRGFVQRQKSETDRRLVEISITEAGLAALNDMQEQYRQSVSELFTVLDDQEQQELSGLLEKLADNWAQRLEDLPEDKRQHRRHRPGRREGRREHA